MAEPNRLDDLQTAIDDLRAAIEHLWSVVPPPANADQLVEFCKVHVDERFPSEFLPNKFVERLENSNWDPAKVKQDNIYEVPEAVMSKLFKEEKEKIQKKMRKVRSKERRTEMENAVIVAPTPEEIELNKLKLVEREDKLWKKYDKMNKEHNEATKLERNLKKISATHANYSARLKGVKKN